jgi:hypothetical protein
LAATELFPFVYHYAEGLEPYAVPPLVRVVHRYRQGRYRHIDVDLSYDALGCPVLYPFVPDNDLDLFMQGRQRLLYYRGTRLDLRLRRA